jgi:MFS family permease
MRLHNRWFQLVALLIAVIMIANLQYAWTLFVTPLQGGTGWKLSEIQAAFTLFILFQTWVQPLDGWLIDRLGPRGFISVAGLLCGLGWAGLGRARLRHDAADAVHDVLRRRHRRCLCLQRLDRIGAEVVQG